MAVDKTLTATMISSWAGLYDTSYVTIEEASSYISTKFKKADIWAALSDANQIAALLTATRDIDGASSWLGCKYFYNQSLEFPRAVTSPTNISEPNDLYYELLNTSQEQVEMQRNVKKACVEQALWIIDMDGDDVHTKNKAKGIASVSEGYGSISESYSYRGGGIGSRLCPEAQKLLRKYISKPKLVRG